MTTFFQPIKPNENEHPPALISLNAITISSAPTPYPPPLFNITGVITLERAFSPQIRALPTALRVRDPSAPPSPGPAVNLAEAVNCGNFLELRSHNVRAISSRADSTLEESDNGTWAGARARARAGGAV